ncbi:hypothetical protein GCM10010168_85800 [Actinoplanes ianthinogenes]|uniref:Uncharacterized protein n=1 Tax=Actinoplanes ianthinogenes TaxID=122358 RepID=A0ABM7M132_9ACTN|nr:hypothetical protein [Actinoplanes ianthinogenes]BCJ45311.1 hypothetical protein Aiant_59680 [Actinoplanes ianthinogenes]GGR53710.1 hypothetical protein GCM10010168_85800 [Actinoplanes ianthinogenes]
MAFPTTPLPIYVGLATGADPVNPATWNYSEITSDVRDGAGVTIVSGRQDEGTQVGATNVNVTLDNRTGRYCRTNPLSDLYGTLDKGSPVQVRVTRLVDTFSRVSGAGLGTEPASGIAWTGNTQWTANGTAAQVSLATDNLAALAITTAATGFDVEISYSCSISLLPTGASWVFGAAFWLLDANTYYRAHTEIAPGGVVNVKVQKRINGVVNDVLGITSTGLTVSAGTVLRNRILVIGGTILIKVWLASGSEPAAWTASVTESQPQSTGAATGLFGWRVSGLTNGSSIVGSVDDWRMDTIRATTPVPEWPVRWDMSGRDVRAPITGAGILRRLSQGQSALQSPIRRQLSAQPVCAYWPLEDGSSATQASSAIAGGAMATAAQVTFGNADCPPGASSAAVLTTSGVSGITGRVNRWTVPQDGYACMTYFRLPTLSGSASPNPTNRLMSINATGTVVRWIIYTTSTGFYISGYLADDVTAIVNTGSFAFSLDPTRWSAIQLETQESGGTVNWSLIWYQIGAGAFTMGNGSYSGTADRITQVTLHAPVDGTLVSHLWAGDDQLAFVDGTFMAVSAAYAGETAGARLARLAAETNVPVTMIGSAANTARMGAQPQGVLLDLVRECEAADQGTLYERGAGLGYVTRASRYNQTPALVLDFNQGHVAEPPEPTDDDQRLRNRITLRSNGSEATAEDTASIAKSGVYGDDPTVNLQADQLSAHAYWRLHLGTVDELRWPQISLDLARNPSLIAAWCSVRIGSRITIANPPSAVAGQPLDLIVEGWTERLSNFSWTVELVCSPARPWDVGVWGATTSRWDSASTTLVSAAAAGATSLPITTATAADCWSTTAVPYTWSIAGEDVTVTSITAPAGTGPYTQTATVTRAVNGIAKSLPAGSSVRLSRPMRWAL